jgi:membrane protein YdbS with pleckstrin-like domain
MGYAEKNLAPGEAILYRARYHWVIYRGSLALATVAIVLGIAALIARDRIPEAGAARALWIAAGAFLAVALVAFLARYLRAGVDEFVVTNRRVMRKVGLLSREIEHAPVEKIQDITIEQGWIGRLLGFGTVVLETASERGTLAFPEIARPEAFRNAIWGQAPASGAAPVPAGDPRDRLARLDGLKQQGLVTEEEYATKRREILADL